MYVLLEHVVGEKPLRRKPNEQKSLPFAIFRSGKDCVYLLYVLRFYCCEFINPRKVRIIMFDARKTF